MINSLVIGGGGFLGVGFIRHGRCYLLATTKICHDLGGHTEIDLAASFAETVNESGWQK